MSDDEAKAPEGSDTSDADTASASDAEASEPSASEPSKSASSSKPSKAGDGATTSRRRKRPKADGSAKAEADASDAKPKSKSSAGTKAKSSSSGEGKTKSKSSAGGKTKAKSGDGKASSSAGGKTKAKSAEGKTKAKSAEGKTKSTSSADEQSEATGADDAEDGPRRDLPKWNRARVKRKAPAGEERDAFQTSVRKAGQSLLQRPVAVLGIILVLGGIAAGGYALWQGRKAEAAGATKVLASAAALEARGQVDETLPTRMEGRVRPLPAPVVESDDALRQAVDQALADLEAEGGSSDANQVADLIRAARLVRAREFSAAESAYLGFLQRLPDHPLAFLAHDGLIVALEAQERYDDALSQLDPLLGEEGSFFRDRALWHKARLLEEAGRADEALEVYRQYATEYPLDRPSLASGPVKARLKELDPDLVPPESGPLLPGMGGLGGL